MTDSIASRLAHLHDRIAAAARSAQRDASSIALVAVTKTVAASSVLDALAAGQRGFGENYAQEGVDKIVAVDAALAADGAGVPSGRRPIWHFIGPIQSNKTRLIATHFDWVHGIDRLKIAERLSAQRDPARGPLDVLIEVNLDGEASKSGVEPDAVRDLAARVAVLANLRFRGLMAVPAPRDDAGAQRDVFARLRLLGESLRDAGLACEHLSMGMSADFGAAIAEGATMVRVGTAIFGARPAREAEPANNETGQSS